MDKFNQKLTLYLFIKKRFIRNIFGGAFLFFLLNIPITVWSQDSLTTVPPSGADSSEWNNPYRVYQDPQYFSNIPVEQTTKKENSRQIASSFSQMKRRYQSRDFNYNEEKLNARSWWNRVQERIKQFFLSFLPNYHFNIEKLFYRILVGIGLIALAYVLYRLFTKGQKLTYKEKKEQARVTVEEVEKKLMDIDLNALLQDARNKKDFTLAIRYLHLINLKELSQKELIHWDYKKTNKEFLREINDKTLQKEFVNTIRIYEYTWYGHFSVTKEDFKAYEQQFEAFKKEIGRKRRMIASTRKPAAQ